MKLISALQNLKRSALLLCLFIAAHNGYSQQPAGYSFGKFIVIQASQVTGTLTNFPMLFSVTDLSLRSTASGGSVQSTNGNDIIFTLNNCATKLDHQIEKYTSTTGELIAWIRIPTLSSAANTTLHMYYGNASAAYQSTNTTWSSNFMAVYHFSNTVTDATSNGRNLTDNNTVNLTGGKIGNGRSLDNTSNTLSSQTSGQYLRLPNSLFSGINNFSFTGWVYLNRTTTSWERIFDFGNSQTENFFLTPSDGTTGGTSSLVKARITIGGSGSEQGPAISNANPVTGAWNHWGVTIDATNDVMSLYKNGVLTLSTSCTLVPNDVETSNFNYFGRSVYTGSDHLIDADFDEFRLANVAHSAGWIATEYNNQNNPSTFYTVGSQTTAAQLCSIALPVELLYFIADYRKKSNEVVLEWQTASELNCSYYTIERSHDGFEWETMKIIKGSGTTQELKQYNATDKYPLPGGVYYRLKQTDYDGSYKYYDVAFADVPATKGSIKLYPNPAGNVINISGVQQASEISIQNNLGLTVKTVFASLPCQVDISDLAAGLYTLKIYTGGLASSFKFVKN